MHECRSCQMPQSRVARFLVLIIIATAIRKGFSSTASHRSTLSAALGDRGTAHVRSGPEFAAAFADPEATSFIILNSIILSSEDWSPYALPVRVDRNITITGASPNPRDWPLIDLRAIVGKAVFGAGLTLVVRWVAIANPRSAGTGMAPGIDLLAPLPPGSIAFLFMFESAIIHQACFPAPLTQLNIESMPRPPGFPGQQQAIPLAGTPAEQQRQQQGGCSGRGAEYDRNLTTPPLRLCWEAYGSIPDVVTYSAAIDQVLGRPKPDGYLVGLYNITYVCESVLSDECIAQYGPAGCWFAAMTASGHGTGPNASGSSTNDTNDTNDINDAKGGVPSGGGGPVAAPPTDSDGGGGHNAGGLPGRPSDNGAIIGGVVGGVGGALTLAGLLALVLWRRKQQRWARDCMADVKVDQSDGSTSSLQEVHVCADASAAKTLSGGFPSTLADSDPRVVSLSVKGGGLLTYKDVTPVEGHDGLPTSTCGSSDMRGGQERAKGQGAASAAQQQGHEAGHVEVQQGEKQNTSDDTADAALCGEQAGESQGPQRQEGAGTGRHGALSYGDDGSRDDSRGPQDADAGALVVVTPLTPHRPDVRMEVEHGTELQLLPKALGRGSFGRVVQGTYQGQVVAVKLVTEAHAIDPEVLAKSFAQEVEVLARCCHPNVVRLLAACLTPPRLCLVMELMDTSLDKLIHNQGAGFLLPLDTVLDIACDIASGLAYLHPTIVHRDLKPGNVLINRDAANGQRPRAKLTDFGLSRLRSSVLVTERPEAGTPAYTAPECMDAFNNRITDKADMYSFGCVLYEMLSGRRPWPGYHLMAIAHSVTELQQRPPLHAVPDSRCSPALRQLVRQCWEADPRRRPAAAEVAKELALLREQLFRNTGGGSGASGDPLLAPGLAATHPVPGSQGGEASPPGCSDTMGLPMPPMAFLLDPNPQQQHRRHLKPKAPQTLSLGAAGALHAAPCRGEGQQGLLQLLAGVEGGGAAAPDSSSCNAGQGLYSVVAIEDAGPLSAGQYTAPCGSTFTGTHVSTQLVTPVQLCRVPRTVPVQVLQQVGQQEDGQQVAGDKGAQTKQQQQQQQQGATEDKGGPGTGHVQPDADKDEGSGGVAHAGALGGVTPAGSEVPHRQASAVNEAGGSSGASGGGRATAERVPFPHGAGEEPREVGLAVRLAQVPMQQQQQQQQQWDSRVEDLSGDLSAVGEASTFCTEGPRR